jgi:aspartyl-tRNA(Asn)/glutamyl-tRNA(Gln) amidotransferase subunit A
VRRSGPTRTTRSAWSGKAPTRSARLTDPADLELRSAAAAIAAGTLSAAELLAACRARAAAVEDLGGFVAMAAEDAGSAGPGPLHGVPVGVKDLVDVAGLPTRGGSAATDDRPAAADAAIVALLRDAGAIVLGKTATHELAYGVTTRAARNPWDLERLAGGSSGGSAVAVAAGACPLALGSDTAGSCRIPAAFCGVAGMMARPGRLPLDGVVALATGLDALGFLARTAADLAFAWSALTGEAVEQPRAGAAPDAALGELVRPAPGLRVGTPPEASLGSGVEPAALAAADEAAAALGGRRVTLDVPPFEDFARPRGTAIAALALREHRRRGWWPQRAGRYGEDVAAEMRAAEAIDDAELQAAQQRLAVLGIMLRDALAPADVLVLPTTAGPAPPRASADPLATTERRHAARFTRLCGPVNVSGLAAVSVFGGLDAAGLPLGVQFVARDEATALGAAVAYEAAAGSPPRPPVLAGAAAGNDLRGEPT